MRLEPSPSRPPTHTLAESDLTRAFKCTANAVFVTDQSGKIVWVNDAFCRLSGYCEMDILGRSPAVLNSGQQSHLFYSDLWHTITSGKPWRGIVVDRRKDGMLYTVDEVITPLLGDDGNITHYIAIQHDITPRSQEHEQESYLAYHDVLTGLSNRAYFLSKQQQAMFEAKRNQRMVAVLFIDLDKFKMINDTLGHATGDALLVAVAERLRSAVRKNDVIARFGGDEFAILVADIHDINIIVALAKKVLDILSQQFLLGDHIVHTYASVGIATYPNDSEEPEVLLTQADQAMYRAKKAGGNRFELYAPAVSKMQ
ncbi:PAS domain S-box-containing protein/diguanylate cyclase (GGDEF)-like protein [Paucimonas lemoignei]|uniref:PAS domain S-box-containing protein/diguanylate cyclase (GGDEF)-like protein n=2 Tax=Paucimonas lemoignei TaxID=29443 RepID=A0A4R3I0Z4_PAULE|nr:PAS domain S-box-containing protein/diguanylate cyclase (GGDEF)-like protein [Paucimonas lemoignei]